LIQNLLPLLPERVGPVGMTALVGTSVFGCGLWLFGARFSRPLLALAASVGGGAIGYQSPHWLGWSVDPLAMAVLGALILGVFGFVAHLYLATLGLGMVAGGWAMLAVVACVGLGNGWSWTDFAASDGWMDYVSVLQRTVPSKLAIVLMYAGGVGLLIGSAFALIFRRLGVVFFWSLTGLSLLLLSVLAAAEAEATKYLLFVPPHASGQIAVLAGLVAMGAAVQWKVTFARRPKARSSAPTPRAADKAA